MCRWPRLHDLLVFREKGAMCQAIHQAGLAVPAFAEAGDADAVRDFAADHGWPVIVKPRIGSSSAGVVRLEGPTDLAAVCFDAEPLPVQAYCADAPAAHMAFPPAQGEVFAPWGAYPPRLSAANIGYRTDIASTFHTDKRQINDSGPAPQTGGEY
jgi:hypothetical protein